MEIFCYLVGNGGVMEGRQDALANMFLMTRQQFRSSVDFLVKNGVLTTIQPQSNHKVTTYALDTQVVILGSQPQSNHKPTTNQPQQEEKRKQEREDLPDELNFFSNPLQEKEEKKKEEPLSTNRAMCHLAEREEFERFRKQYGGRKRGFDVEFKNFKDKNKNWYEIVPLLQPGYDRLLEHRKQLERSGRFVPELPMLQTWLNQKRWTEEFPVVAPTINGNSEAGVKINTKKIAYGKGW